MLGGKNRQNTNQRYYGVCILLAIVMLWTEAAQIKAAQITGEDAGNIQKEYQAYQERLSSIAFREDIEENGYEIMEEQIFPITLESFGLGELTMIPAIETSLNRLALFFLDGEGNVVYSYDQLEANCRIRGELKQSVKDVAGVSFSDVIRDGRNYIIIISM